MTTDKEKEAGTRLKKFDSTYWMKFCLAILAALLCVSLRLKVEGVIVGVGIYLLSHVLSRYVIRDALDRGATEFYLSGLGTYCVTWITFWFFLYTLLETL